jgi:hypothetical protein
VLSERVLLGPLYRERREGMLAQKPTRDIIRAVVHMPSMAWAGLAIGVLVNRMAGGGDVLPVLAIIIFAVSGAMNLLALRKAHPGGIILLAMAITTFADIWTN